MSLAGSIAEVAGQPATMRVGVVTSTSPLTVNVQGTPFTGMGRIGAVPAVGSTVLMLGQSVQGSRSSGSSWVVVGVIQAT